MDEKIKHKYIYYSRFAHWLYDIYKKLAKNIYWGSIPLKSSYSHKPFFIVGCGRSGNTILRRVLNSKEGIVIPPETYVLGKIIRQHNAYKNLKWGDYVNLQISTIEYSSAFYTFEIDSLAELALDLKKMPEKERSLSNILNRFYIYYGKKKNLKVKRWGDKTPMNSIFVYRLKKIFPNAQFIHIMRNGIDVTYSYVNSGLISDSHKAATRWKKTVKFLRDFGEKHSKNYYELKYEDLVSKPEFSVKEVCDFLDIDFKKEMLTADDEFGNLGDVKYLEHHHNVYSSINTDSIGKGEKNFSDKELDEVKEIIGNLNNRLGYN